MTSEKVQARPWPRLSRDDEITVTIKASSFDLMITGYQLVEYCSHHDFLAVLGEFREYCHGNFHGYYQIETREEMLEFISDMAPGEAFEFGVSLAISGDIEP